MSELLVLHELFKRARKGEPVLVSELLDSLELETTPYCADEKALEQLLFKLGQEGILKGNTRDGMIYFEEFRGSPDLDAKIARLNELFNSSSNIEDFREKIHLDLEINHYFFDDREIIEVYQFLLEHSPLDLQVREADTERGMASDEGEDPVLAAREREREKRVELESIAMDYVEKLLQKETIMDQDVLCFMLDDLLPLKQVHLLAGDMVEKAISERKLPWVLEGSTYKRVGGTIMNPEETKQAARTHEADLTSGANDEPEIKEIEFTTSTIENFLLDHLPKGKRISIIELNEKLSGYLRSKEPSRLFHDVDKDMVEDTIADLIKQRKMKGYFEDEEHFFRKW